LGSEVNLYGQNLFGDSYHFTEYSRGWVNTLPLSGGAGIYLTLSIEM